MIPFLAAVLAANPVVVEGAVAGISRDGHWVLVKGAPGFTGVDLLRSSSTPLAGEPTAAVQRWSLDRQLVAVADTDLSPRLQVSSVNTTWTREGSRLVCAKCQRALAVSLSFDGGPAATWHVPAASGERELSVEPLAGPGGVPVLALRTRGAKERLELLRVPTAAGVEVVATGADPAEERALSDAARASNLSLSTITPAKKARTTRALYADAAHAAVATALAQRLGVATVEPLTWKAAAGIVVALPAAPEAPRSLLPRRADLVMQARGTCDVAWTADGRFVVVAQRERRLRMLEHWCLPGTTEPVAAPGTLSAVEQARLEPCGDGDDGDEEEEELDLRTVIDTWAGTVTDYPLADRLLAFRGQAKSLREHGGRLRREAFEAWSRLHPLASPTAGSPAPALHLADPAGVELPEGTGFIDDLDAVVVSTSGERLEVSAYVDSSLVAEPRVDPTGKRAVVWLHQRDVHVQSDVYPGGYALAVVALAPTVELQAGAAQLQAWVDTLERAGFAVTRRVPRTDLTASKVLVAPALGPAGEKLGGLSGVTPAPLTFEASTNAVLYVGPGR